MKSYSKNYLLALTLLVSGFALAARINDDSVFAAGAALCVSHDYLGQRPNSSHDDEGDLPWSLQAQGLAHDRDNWYVTNNDTAIVLDPTTGVKFVVNPILRRIPVTTDLADGDVHCSDPGISCSQLVYDTTLFALGYNHYGDPDFFDFQGTGYVVVPIENGVPGAGVAVFRGDASLQFLSFAPYPRPPDPITRQDHSSWVALDPDGLLLSSNSGDSFGVGEVHRYRVHWAHLKDTCERRMCELLLDWIDTIALKDEAGNALQLRKISGGEFSDDGLYLYVLSAEDDANGGINVFQTRPGSAAECGPAPCIVAQRVEHSTNESGLGGFKYEFHPGDFFPEEPEGLTFWDLDADGRAPCSSSSPLCTEGKLGGQLHVMLLHLRGLEDEIDVKHYRRFLDVSPPAITCPGNAVVECTASSGVAAADPQLSSFFAGASATDTCDEHPAVSNNAPAFFNLGTTPVTFTATDHSGNAASCVAQVTVRDTRPPQISVAVTPVTLWPPNHKMIRVTARVTVSDRCDASVTFTLVSIMSNEPDSGLGDGDTPVDIQDAQFGTADTTFALRAERSGGGTGRIYTILYRAKDASGNESMATALVRVPHN